MERKKRPLITLYTPGNRPDLIEKAARFEPDNAAIRRGVTMSQLVKLVKQHPPALSLWNKAREERKKHPLK